MALNQRTLRCTPESVVAVLADGWLYPSWVVGASRMRDVDHNWPEKGSMLWHSVGVWPLLINDRTEVLRWDPPKEMVFRAHGWPVGEAHVAISLEPQGEDTIVKIREYAVRGPAKYVPRIVQNVLMGVRNRETLHRLAYLAEGREQYKAGTIDHEAAGVDMDAEEKIDVSTSESGESTEQTE